MPALSVLIIEDSLSDAELILHALRKCYEPLEYQRVYDAEGMVVALQSRAWEVVLCDYRLPGFDWPAPLNLSRVKDPFTPVIVVSGYQDDRGLAAIRDGAQDYVRKEDLSRLCFVIDRELIQMRAQREHEAATKALLKSLEKKAKGHG